MSDYDKECIDLPMIHGMAVEMECLRGWTNDEYKDAVSPFYLSAKYRITYEDGANVEIGSLFAYTLSQGSFWYSSDSKADRIDSVFARDTRVLAYLAQVGQVLKREESGKCILPSEEEAERILAELDIPIEGLAYGSETAGKNMDRWIKDWQQRSLIKWDEEENGWRITH